MAICFLVINFASTSIQFINYCTVFLGNLSRRKQASVIFIPTFICESSTDISFPTMGILSVQLNVIPWQQLTKRNPRLAGEDGSECVLGNLKSWFKTVWKKPAWRCIWQAYRSGAY